MNVTKGKGRNVARSPYEDPLIVAAARAYNKKMYGHMSPLPTGKLFKTDMTLDQLLELITPAGSKPGKGR